MNNDDLDYINETTKKRTDILDCHIKDLRNASFGALIFSFGSIAVLGLKIPLLKTIPTIYLLFSSWAIWILCIIISLYAIYREFNFTYDIQKLHEFKRNDYTSSFQATINSVMQIGEFNGNQHMLCKISTLLYISFIITYI